MDPVRTQSIATMKHNKAALVCMCYGSHYIPLVKAVIYVCARKSNNLTN